MYFDAAVVFVTNFLLLFGLALAILCIGISMAKVEAKQKIVTKLFTWKKVSSLVLKVHSGQFKKAKACTESTCQGFSFIFPVRKKKHNKLFKIRLILFLW